MSVGFARHINGHLNQVVRSGNGIHLGQHATTIVIDADLTRVDVGNINAQVSKVGSSQFIDARFRKTDFVPTARSHCRAMRIGWIRFLSTEVRRENHRERCGQQLLVLVTFLTEGNDAHRKKRFIARA